MDSVPCLTQLSNRELSRTLDRIRQDAGDSRERPVLSSQFVFQLSYVLNAGNKMSILKFCRWAAAFCPPNQNLIWSSFSDRLLSILKKPLDPELRTLVLQVIGNSLVQNSQNCEAFFEQCGLRFVFKYINSSDPATSNTAIMLGLFLTQAKPDLVLREFQTKYLCELLDGEDSTNDLWLECLIQEPSFIPAHFPGLGSGHSVKLLQLITGNPVCLDGLPEDAGLYFTELLCSMSETIMNSKGEVFPELVTSLVEMLCKLVLIRQPHLQADPKLVTSVILLLRGVHEAGQSAQNQFTPIHKLDQIQNQDLQTHPTYSFKANLIRLLGALVDGHKDNQDKVYDLGTLRVVLECTKIDALNPFIPQCAILTLKFLLRDNLRNQDFVNEMSNEGFVPLEI